MASASSTSTAEASNHASTSVARNSAQTVLSRIPRPSPHPLKTPTSQAMPPQRLWHDDGDYQTLYEALRNVRFDSYDSIDLETIQREYRIPSSSTRCVQMALQGDFGGENAVNIVAGSEHYVGFSARDFIAKTLYSDGLTLGEAIQKIYMVRLREENGLLPMVEAYEGGWSVSELSPACIGTRSFGGTSKAGTVWLGDVIDSVNFDLLRDKDITALVSIHPQGFRSKGQEKHGNDGQSSMTSPIRWHKRVELADSKESDLDSEFSAIFDFIQEHIVSGQNVLVHCIAGKSRSVAVVRDYVQRIEIQRGILDVKTGTPLEKYQQLVKAREETFERLKLLRPGITEGNFKEQLDNSTRRLCRLPPNAKSASSEKKEAVKNAAGGKLGEAVAMAFFFYRLRPTRHVIQKFEDVRQSHESKRISANGSVRVGLTFSPSMIRWYEDCKAAFAAARAVMFS